jgi:LacI family transcriptional regulator
MHSLGHTRIAHIVGLAHTKPAADRLLGYRAEVHAVGLEPRPEYEVQGDFYTESGEAAMRALLALPEPPTAVFAASDLMAVGAIKAVEDAGLRCPDDVAVVGFDDAPLAATTRPALTTVRQPLEAMTRAMVELLLGRIEGTAGNDEHITCETVLVARESA